MYSPPRVTLPLLVKFSLKAIFYFRPSFLPGGKFYVFCDLNIVIVSNS